MDLIELERNMLLTMPGGWKMSQVEPQFQLQPFDDFLFELKGRQKGYQRR